MTFKGEYYRALYQRQAGKWELFASCACHQLYPGGMGPVTIDQLLGDSTPAKPIREARFATGEAVRFQVAEETLLPAV